MHDTEEQALRFFVGSRGPATTYIHRMRYSPSSQRLQQDGEPVESVNPSFGVLHPNGRVLYVVNEIGGSPGGPEGAVSAFSVDPNSLALRALNTLPSGGAAPCHVSIEAFGRHIFVANYWGGSVATFSLDADGSLAARTALVQHRGRTPEPGRDGIPHAHAIRLDPAARHAVATDLGRDEILAYDYDGATGNLAGPAATLSLGRGAGPRHFVFGRGGERIFLINELDSTIAVLAYGPEAGGFNLLQTVGTCAGAPPSGNAAAEISLSPDGRHLYASNRGEDTIAIFATDASSCLLTPLARISTQGRTPRHFSMDAAGRYLVVANQESGTVVAFARDRTSGLLHLAAPPHPVASPVWIGMVRSPAMR